MNLAELISTLIDKTASNKITWVKIYSKLPGLEGYGSVIQLDEHVKLDVELRRPGEIDSRRTGVVITCYHEHINHELINKVFEDSDPGSEMFIELYYLAKSQVSNNDQDAIDSILDFAINHIKEL